MYFYLLMNKDFIIIIIIIIKNEISRLLANRLSSTKVLMTEPDIAHAVKEILGARVVYPWLHLARWISVRNSSEILFDLYSTRNDPDPEMIPKPCNNL